MRSLFLLLGVVVFVEAAPLPKASKEPNYFPAKEGSVWEYSKTNDRDKKEETYTVKITKVVKKEDEVTVTFEPSQFGKYDVVITPKSVKQLENRPRCEGDRLRWTTGAKMGDSWEFSVEDHNGAVPAAGIPPFRTDFKVTIGDIEEVKVPAGTFKAQVIHTKFIHNEPGDDKPYVEMKEWFVDGIGCVRLEALNYNKNFRGDQKKITLIQELKKYTPGK